jgi:hypothetical protein
MSEPRNTDARIKWFLDHNPSGSGMCAQHSWHSLGGDNGNPPAWGCSDANEVYAKVKSSGRYWTGTPKRGALILWKYGNNGHAAICYNAAGDKIATTDPSGNPYGSDVESITYPHKWGATTSARIWTDQYNGVRFAVDSADDEDDDMPSAEQIADAVWASKTEDPVTGDEVSMRELNRRTRTAATQARDAARAAEANTEGS